MSSNENLLLISGSTQFFKGAHYRRFELFTCILKICAISVVKYEVNYSAGLI